MSPPSAEPSPLLRALGRTHGKLVHGRRVTMLARAIGRHLEPGWSVLDVGCGDGRLGALLAEGGEELTVRGLDRFVREDTLIPVEGFDGERLDLADRSVDAVVFVDVLHHTDDPRILLAEAARVARHAVILKDHRMERPLAGPTLRLMDWVGNRPHGVPLPYNYWPESRWRSEWEALGLRVEAFDTQLGIYPWVARWAFESGLHFVAKLAPG